MGKLWNKMGKGDDKKGGDALSELKNLPPEERVKKLKEIEERNKKEIEKAHKLIQESMEEIEGEKQQKEQIPIPQVTSIDSGMLFGEEEKALFNVKRFE